MERIVFLDRDAIRVKIRKPRFLHHWQEYASTSPEQVVERLQGATIAITNRVPLSDRELRLVPSLKLIAVAATGVDCVDLAACRRYDIAVANVRHWCRASVPEHVFALILALRRNLVAYHETVQSGAWQQSDRYCLPMYPMPCDLNGSTLGIVGYGSLGRTVEKLALAFGMEVLIAEHKQASSVRSGRVTFDQVLHRSDVLALLCPLTAATQGLIGAAELQKMAPHAVLINCARGGIVDESALAAALQAGNIGGAGLDVLSNEPPQSGNPLLDLKLPNLIVTPHIAWASVQSLQTLTEQLIDNLEAFVDGEAQNLVG